MLVVLGYGLFSWEILPTLHAHLVLKSSGPTRIIVQSTYLVFFIAALLLLDVSSPRSE